MHPYKLASLFFFVQFNTNNIIKPYGVVLQNIITWIYSTNIDKLSYFMLFMDPLATLALAEIFPCSMIDSSVGCAVAIVSLCEICFTAISYGFLSFI